jgi:hypothetical protein
LLQQQTQQQTVVGNQPGKLASNGLQSDNDLGTLYAID